MKTRSPEPRPRATARTAPHLLSAALFLGAAGPHLAARGPADDGLSVLRAEIERLAEGARGTVGVGVLHLESGRELYVNGDEACPMASTYKVPIAVQLLTRVDRGEIRLDSLVSVGPGTSIRGAAPSPTSSTIPGCSSPCATSWTTCSRSATTAPPT